MIILLAALGLIAGAAANWCIAKLADGNSRASAIGCLALVRWLSKWSERAPAERTRWLRSLLIELAWMIGLPLIYLWYLGNGLTGGVAAPADWTSIWFWGHAVLLFFLVVATFIDFDQRIIPDSVTVPGTLIALLFAAIWPSFRLPELIVNLAGAGAVNIDFADGAPLPAWHLGSIGLLAGLSVFAIWIAALLPKFPLMSLSFRSLCFTVGSTVRFLQRNGLKVRNRSRRVGLTYLAIGAAGLLAISIAWQFLPMVNRTSLFGALVGMGFGGLMIWLVRIVASHSLGQEALGFGDVTLMAMIGAFLGWQASLIVFSVSPFAALAIVLVNYLITKDNELAFGPYLCLGAVITVGGWSSIWPLARDRFFLMPLLLLAVLAGSLVLLMFMMLGVRRMKGD